MPFIPTIWSKEFDIGIEEQAVSAVMSNTRWEGEIKSAGDSVKILEPGDVTLKPYSKGVDIDSPEHPTDSDKTLIIDQQEYFNVGVDDIDKVQSKVDLLSVYRTKGGRAIRKGVDGHILALYTDVYPSNIITPDAPLTKDNVWDLFNSAYIQLIESHEITEEIIPAAISPKVYEVIREYFAGKQTTLGDKVSENGKVGVFAGFSLHLTKNLTIVDEDIDGDSTDEEVHKILIGGTTGITRASQINKIESYRPEKGFEDAIKGLVVFGAKMLKSGKANALLNLYFEK